MTRQKKSKGELISGSRYISRIFFEPTDLPPLLQEMQEDLKNPTTHNPLLGRFRSTQSSNSL